MSAAIWSLPLVGALIGWVTNWLAVKMIFRPRQPIKILGFTIWGLIPRRRQELADNVGKTVGQDLVHIDDLIDKVDSTVIAQHVMPLLMERTERFIRQSLQALGPLAAAFVSDDLIDSIKAKARAEFEPLIDDLKGQLSGHLAEHVDIEQFVRDKVKDFDAEKVEEIVLRIAAKELKAIEILGGVLGFMVGLFQVAWIKFSMGSL